MPKRICSIDGCEQPARGHGWCNAHWTRWRRHGDPLAGGPPQPRRTPIERFLAKVDKDGSIPDFAPHLGPCWAWTAGWPASQVYPKFLLNGANMNAHRAAYLLLVGPIPEGRYHVDHLCRNQGCVNPAHLVQA